MMFNNKFVACVKANGKVLREQKDTVRVPYGTEYTILLKNLNTVRALVTITIDGKDIGDGTSFVVSPGQSMELERFITNGNMKEGNRFKFIERTAKIEQNRGIDAEDGIVRVVYQFEKAYQQPAIYRSLLPSSPAPWYNQPYSYCDSTAYNSGVVMDCDYGDVSGSIAMAASGPSANYSATAQSATLNSVTKGFTRTENENGITVPGSVSSQQFVAASWFPTETESHAIVLKLLGEIEGQPVKEAVTVQHKPKCVTCGHTNKATAKFCSECGTALQIV